MARSEAPQRGDSRLGRQSPPPFLPVCTRTAGAAVGVFAWIAFLSLLLVLVCFFVGPAFGAVRDGSLAGFFFLMCLLTFLWDWVLASVCCWEADRAGLWVPVDAGVGSATEHVRVNIRIYPQRQWEAVQTPSKGLAGRSPGCALLDCVATPLGCLGTTGWGCADGLNSLCPHTCCGMARWEGQPHVRAALMGTRPQGLRLLFGFSVNARLHERE